MGEVRFGYYDDDGWVDCDEHDKHVQKAEIDISDYHGYKKAVRIVRDRAIQQIDKSQADEHGYRLLRADLRQYSREQNNKGWLITRSTPYSVKMGLEDAYAMILFDLREYYGYRDIPKIEAHAGSLSKYVDFDADEILDYYKRFYVDKDTRRNISNQEMLRKLDFMDSCDGKFAFEINRIASNASAGVYEVSYWATALI